MNVGTKSLLFGVHQFVIHPLTVIAAWKMLYGKFPTWRETVCIVVHDWGYWGKVNMDGRAGELHPEVGASIALRLFGRKYYRLCLFHSRHYARNAGVLPSRLCWADKASIAFEPWWFYIPRAWASGELREYRIRSHEAGLIDENASHREWYSVMQDKLMKIGRERRGDAVQYVNPSRNTEND